MKSSLQLFFAVLIVNALFAGCRVANDAAPVGTTAGAATSAKAITAFGFANPTAAGAISESTMSIAVSVPAGTDVRALVATFTTTGVSVRVGTTAQVSGTTPNDFTSPVLYTVTAIDGTTATYTVIVTVSAVQQISSKTFLTFELAGVSGAINETAKTISVVLPPDGTDVTTLVATFTISGASVRVGTTVQVSGTTPNNFTNPVSYIVIAADNSSATYTVTVSILAAPKLMTAFSFSAVPATGVIDQAARTVAVSMPLGPNLATLVASFATTTGAIVKIGPAVQTSGTTPNDFTSPVTYTVIAPDGLEANYTVTVTIDPPRMTAFSFAAVPATGVIDHTVGAIAVTVPARTNVTTLVSTFTTTSASLVTIGTTTQTSGATANDFTNPVTYTVTGAGVQTKNYTVTVTIAPGVLNLPRTGQVTSYSTPSTNDDGKLQKGVVWPVPRFTPNADTSLTDNLTGLIWAPDGNSPTAGGLCTGGTKTWQEALSYVSCLNTNNYLTHNDWRLPNANELTSLLTATAPIVHTVLNGQGFSNMQGNFYFTSTTDPAIVTQSRKVNMVTGNVVVGLKSDPLNVIPVRGTSNGRAPVQQTGQITSFNVGDDGDLEAGIAWPVPRFTNPDGTAPVSGNLVVDQLTGLLWTQDGNTPGSTTCPMDGTWQAALEYVACLNANSYLGNADWRLPNINELASLINAEQVNSASWLNSQGFVTVQGNFYWSSTTDASSTGNAWGIFMAGGDKDSSAKTNNGNGGFKAWPVRSGF